jgi:hypothetical protein
VVKYILHVIKKRKKKEGAVPALASEASKSRQKQHPVGFAYFVGKAKIIKSLAYLSNLCTYTGKPKGKRKRRLLILKEGLAN